MGLTKFPFGVSSFGMPQLAAGDHFTTGNVFFVDSGATNATNGNTGDSPDKPLATLNGAMDKCTANNGDMVFLMPGHGEDLDAATDAVIDVAGVKVIGIGDGPDQPTFTFTGTAGSFECDVACHVENVKFLASVSAVVVGVNIDAHYVTLKNCVWDFDATGDDFLIMVDIDAFDDFVIDGCEFRAENAAGADEAIRLDDANDGIIANSRFFGDFANAVIINAGADTLCANLTIVNNYIYNADTAAAQNGIDLNNACTGVIANNRIGGLQATGVANLLDPGSCLCMENYGVNAIDETAIVIPTTAST